MIEIMSFRLASGCDQQAFLASDRRVQTEFAYHQPGLLRRTTARNRNGVWIVIDLWRSEPDADACTAHWGHDPATAEFMSFIEAGTVGTERYHQLD